MIPSAKPTIDRDVPAGNLVLGQLRERNLPVASAMFCEHLRAGLERVAVSKA
jgi:hypothetical protein